MKIALCLSGHLRDFEKTYPSLNNNLINDNVDIFIHTWDKLGFSCPYKTDHTLNDTNTKLNSINNTYNPKKIIIEPSSFIEELKLHGNEYAPHLRNEPKHVGHMASMFYKIYACNELRKKYELDAGIKYDLIIRCRSDLYFTSKINLDNIPSKTIVLPKSSSNPDWYNDQFAIGSSDEMDLYSSFFFDIPEYFKQRNEFYPEKFMVWSFNKKMLKPHFNDINFYIHR